MAPPLYSEEWNASCAQRPASIRDDSTVPAAFFNFNYFLIAFTIVYYVVFITLFLVLRRKQTSAYLKKRDINAILLAFFGCVCVLLFGPVRDVVGRQIFPCSATLWLRAFGTVGVTLPILMRLNYFGIQMHWSKAMQTTSLQRLQNLAADNNSNDGPQGLPVKRKFSTKAFSRVTSSPPSPRSAPAFGSIAESDVEHESHSQVSSRREGASRGGTGPASSVALDSETYAKLVYRMSFRYNFLVVTFPLMPVLIAGIVAQFALPYYRANCIGCYEQAYYFLVIALTINGLISAVAYFAWQLRNSPDPLGLLYEVKMLVLMASPFGFVGLIGEAIDEFVNRPHDRGIFSWDWISLMALYIQFFWLCVHPVIYSLRLSQKVSGAQIDFRSFLTNPKGVKLFGEHLTNEWAVENLRFWSQVESFKSSYDRFKSIKESNLVAWQTYETFIRPGAVLDVNLPSSIRDQIINIFETKLKEDPEFALGAIPSTVFDTAQKEVFELMERDGFQRFQKTSAFKAFTSENTVLDTASHKVVVVADPRSE